MFRNFAKVVMLCFVVTSPVFAQINDTGQVNNEYDRGDGALIAWATTVVGEDRGPQDYQLPELGLSSYGLASDVLGSAGTPASLGDGGSITVGFDMAISNGVGGDRR